MSAESLPEYIPETFCRLVCEIIRVEKDRLEDADFFHLTEVEELIAKDRLQYACNFIENHLMIKDFYQKCSGNSELMADVLDFFTWIPYWRHGKRTTLKEDFASVERFKKAIEQALVALEESSMFRSELDIRWRRRLHDLILKSNTDVTAKGEEALRATLSMVFLTPMDGKPLADKGYITNMGAIFGTKAEEKETRYFLKNLIADADNTRFSIEQRKQNIPVKKIHAQDSHVHYAVRILKDLFTTHKIAKRAHA